MFRASGESMRTQCKTSNMPVPSLEACDPSRLNSQLRRLEFANWAQLVWLPFIIAAVTKHVHLHMSETTREQK